MGAQIIGGCCATGPEHIAALPAAVKRTSELLMFDKAQYDNSREISVWQDA
jgi:uncharacterized protein (DUF2237 family)